MKSLLGLVVAKAHAQDASLWSDEIAFTLEPGETDEIKLTRDEGDTAQYRMTVEGGRVNYDLHAHGGGQSITYERGRGSNGSEGEIVAAFPGDHGWFLRNRDDETLQITLLTRGEYSDLKQGE